MVRRGEPANLEKAIEIKRRAQRCIQNGDLEGALSEYEKLVGAPDSDPYNYVLLADLLYKKGDQAEAAERYLAAVSAYQTASLYKNAIAVCKKMVRLSLSPAKVLQSLANLHALDGLVGEAALYYVQYAEHLVRSGAPAAAAGALRQAFDLCQDNIRVLEQLSEAWLLAGEGDKAAHALLEAAAHYTQSGLESDARRCEQRAAQLGDASVADADAVAPPAEAAPVAEAQPVVHTPEPGAIALDHAGIVASLSAVPATPDAPVEHARVDGFETGRHHAPEAAQAETEATPAEESPAAEAAEAAEAVAESPVAPVAEHVDEPIAEAAPAPQESAPVLRAPVDTSIEADAEASEPREFVIDESDFEDAPVYEIGDDAVAENEAVEEESAPVYSIDVDEADAPVEAEPVEESEAETVYEIADEDADAAMPVIAESEVVEAGEPVYEIGDDATMPALAADMLAASEPEPADDVYEIEAADELPPIASIVSEAETEPEPAEAVYEIDAEAAEPEAVPMSSSPRAPGLAFPPAAAAPVLEPTPEEQALAQVEELLVHAQTQFRSGDRDEASMTLAKAAQVCESIGRLENAATIYRSLGRGPHATPPMLELWLANCERRHDAHEAGQVACELGDRALTEGDESAARGWFQRAIAFDGNNETAQRRLHRLGEGTNGEPAGDAGIAIATTTQETASTDGKVEVAVGRAEAVSFDLAGLLAEFQRGVEAQLAGDAQGQYDLGMTYREMGLLDQAMEAFRAASHDPRFAARSLEMTGRCLVDQGRANEAVGEFRRALEQPGMTDAGAELRYHLGIALEGANRHDEALEEYVQVQAAMPGYEDVDQRVEAMRRWLGRA